MSKLIAPFSSQEVEVVKNNLLNNIASAKHTLTKVTEQTVLEAMPGAVVAAPAVQSATFSQDYFFYWVRDGAITMEEVAYLYEHEPILQEKENLKQYLLDYLAFVKKIQAQPALNGINVLGEPKFNVNGTLWTGEWSRPQNDGAAYQAITLTHIANIFLNEGQKDFVIQNIYDPHNPASILKANLEYTAANWGTRTIGPWEELLGFHFSVQAVQRRALLDGAALATRLEDPGAANYYLQQAQHVSDFLNAHWDQSLGYYFETFKEQDLRGGGITSSLVAGLVYGQTNAVNDPFSLATERAMSTVFYVRDTFEKLYQINTLDAEQGRGGPLIGRYQNDLYDGNQFVYGNPWFLCSNLVAAFYYRTAQKLLAGEKLMVSFLVKQFFSQVAPELSLTIGQVFEPKMRGFKDFVTALVAQGDAILAAVKARATTYLDGSTLHMSEQINRASGHQVSAPDLSWSYATLLTAMHARGDAVKLLSGL